MTQIIDRVAASEQFDNLDEETREILLEAVQNDLQDWVESLKIAKLANDQEGVSQARHALKGLCGTFGASSLSDLAESAHLSAQSEAELSGCLSETISAIMRVARGPN